MVSSKPEPGSNSVERESLRPSFLHRLKSSLLAGLLVVAPFSITLWLAWEIIGWIDSLVLPFIPEDYMPKNPLPVHVPGFGLLIFLVFLIIVGWLAKNLFGREIIRMIEGWVARMPVFRSIYNGLKQILETLLMQSSNSFEHACLVEYPRTGVWSIGFVSTTTKGEIARRVGQENEMMSVFVPTTPNPTSGYLLFLPREDVIILDMTIEEAAKMVISAGLITPPERAAMGAEESAADHAPPPAPTERRDSPGRAAENAARNPLIPPSRR